MNRLFWKPLLGVLALLLPSAAVSAAPPDVTPLAIGSPAPDFKLPGVDGKTYTLADFAQSKVLFIVFTCNHCPTAQAYEGRIARLCSDYREKGVAVVAISPNNPRAVRLDELGYTDLGDSFEEMKIRAKDHNYPYPYLYDGETQSVAREYGVIATPQVFIFDAGPQAPLHRPVRRWRSEAGQVPRRQERRRSSARRYRSRGEDHARTWLLDQVGREGGRRSQVARALERRACLPRRRSIWPVSPCWQKTTRRSCGSSTSGRPGAAPAWQSCPSSSP